METSRNRNLENEISVCEKSGHVVVLVGFAKQNLSLRIGGAGKERASSYRIGKQIIPAKSEAKSGMEAEGDGMWTRNRECENSTEGKGTEDSK